MVMHPCVVAATLDLEIWRLRDTAFHMTVKVQNIVVIGMNKCVSGITRQRYRLSASGIVILNKSKLSGRRKDFIVFGDTAEMVFPGGYNIVHFRVSVGGAAILGALRTVKKRSPQSLFFPGIAFDGRSSSGLNAISGVPMSQSIPETGTAMSVWKPVIVRCGILSKRVSELALIALALSAHAAVTGFLQCRK